MWWGHLKKILLTVSSIVDALLDGVMPPQIHAHRVKSVRFCDLSPRPRVHRLLKQEIVTLLSYQDLHVKDIITGLKYERSTKAAHLCARVLADYLYDEISSAKSFSSRPIYILPIPLHTSRQRERGFNQIERICEYMPEALCRGPSALFLKNVLIRTRATPPQAQCSRPERLKNIRGAFTLKNPSQLQGSHIFLIDDVTTTGSTLAEAATVIRRAKAKVSCIAIARA